MLTQRLTLPVNSVRARSAVNLLKVSPSMAISFVSYEATKQWLGA